MTSSSKRLAEEEAKPSRASKRQAAIPSTTRMTRSAYKQLTTDNTHAVVALNPGLATVPRSRKKAGGKTTRTADAPPRASTVVNSPTKLEMLPATTYVVAPSKPARQACSVPVVVYAVAPLPDGGEIRAPIRMGSEVRPPHNKLLCKKALQKAAERACVPVACMGGNVPLTISYIPARQRSPKAQTARAREWSHSSQISPTSGPVQFCAPPTSSFPGQQRASWTSGSSDSKASERTADTEIPWRDCTRFNSGWLTESVDKHQDLESTVDMDLCMTPEKESMPAVMEATYAVECVQQATELFARELAAQELEQYSELAVAEISVAPSPVDIFHEDMYVSQTMRGFNATLCNVSTMEWAASEDGTKSSHLGFNGILADSPWPMDHSQAPLPSSATDEPAAAAYMETVPSSDATGSLPSIAESKEESCPSPSVKALFTSRIQQQAAKREANLQREKELRAQLIHMRNDRVRRVPQNVLVRAVDGSMSIATVLEAPSAAQSWPSHWLTEEDRYSVEEYEEDTVSY